MAGIEIKPENQFNTEEIAKNLKEMDGPALVEMEEDRIMPLYIFGGELAAPILGNTVVNVMGVALHLKKENQIQVRGRLRFESTGRKTMFEMKEKWPIEDIIHAQWKIKEFYETMIKKMFLTEVKPSFEIHFKVGETMKETIRKMNDSNQFNLGTMPK